MCDDSIAVPPSKKFKQSTLKFTTSASRVREISSDEVINPASSSDSLTEASSESHTDLDICHSECCEVRSVPFQPQDASTMEKTRKQQGKKSRRFSPSWYESFPWISLCTTRYRAFCAYCRYCHIKQLSIAKKGEDSFILTGFDNWKKAHERFAQHASSEVHRESIFFLESLNRDNIQTLLNKQLSNEQKIHRSNLHTQLSALRYLLRQGLALRGHDEMEGNLYQLLKLLSNYIPDLKLWLSEKKYFSPVILNEQISVIGLTLLRRLLADIRTAEWFAVIADEASDISNKEQLSICIRWVDGEFNIPEDPVEMICLPKTDAATIASALKDCLIRMCLPLSQCRGQAYDGASNMSGHLTGVAARIEKEFPSAIYVHCFAHCTNLVLQSTSR